MNLDSNIFTRLALDLLEFGIFVVGSCCLLIAAHFLLTLPMRRAERARLFLDFLETTLQQGRPVEETILSLAQSRDLSMGPRFHLLAVWLEQHLSLDEALARVPRFLPPQVTAMLLAGRKIGDLRKVLPACRQLLKDAVSQARSAINYLVILTFVITPMGVFVAGFIKVKILPKFMQIMIGMGMDGGTFGHATKFIFGNVWALIAIQAGLLWLLWLGVLAYSGGPRLAARFSFLDRCCYRLPWRRKRMERDFSTMLAILLDSGVSEPEAVALAADCTVNKCFRRRAARVLDKLKQGLSLTQAIEAMDDSGEFGWRLANAFHGRGGFLRALAGWHESLDAKAFQQEQAAAHGITSALVLWTGLFVGAIAVSVFTFLVSIINWGVLW